MPLSDAMAALRAAGDFFSVTYYPLNPDFTMRPPTDVSRDFARMRTAAAGQPILVQEFGYPTSALNDSSPQRQAEFIAAVFDELMARPTAYIAANFLFMSDLSDKVVDGFGGYYGLTDSSRFKAYLKTLGLFDDQGQPKPGWTTFRDRGRKLQDAPAAR
jgi:hypothetical protein